MSREDERTLLIVLYGRLSEDRAPVPDRLRIRWVLPWVQSRPGLEELMWELGQVVEVGVEEEESRTSVHKYF